MAEQNTLLNAAIGAAVSVVFTFLPFSPVIGGATAGYLQGGDYREGGKVGAISGAIAAIPLALVFLLLISFFTIVPSVGGRAGVGVFLGFLIVVAASFALVYVVGLSALGGMLGVALADEFRDGSRSDRLEKPHYVEPPVETVEERRRNEP